MAKAEFDSYSANYEEALKRGIDVSGEDSAYFAKGRLRWLDKILTKRGYHPKSVLDFGCGVGNSLPFVREIIEANRIAGIDISSESIAQARQRHAQSGFEIATLDELPDRENFDVVFCNGVFHHIPLTQRAASARLVYRHLRSRGLFAFFENNPLNPGTRYVMSRIPFDRDAITLMPWEARRLLRDAGFKILRTDYLFYFPKPLAWLRVTEPFLARIPLGAQYMILGEKNI